MEALVGDGARNIDREHAADLLDRYTRVGTASPRHDARGNLAWDGRADHAYDAENRLTRMSAGGGGRGRP